MAPEQLEDYRDGGPSGVDQRTDLFSLGVVLWEMLTGRRLFRGKSDLDTLKNVLEAEIPVPSSLRPEVPSGLDFVVMRALRLAEKGHAVGVVESGSRFEDNEFPKTTANSEAAPGFAMAHLGKAWVFTVANDPVLRTQAEALVETARTLPLSEREAAHLAALSYLCKGARAAAVAVLDRHLMRHPFDLVAHQGAALTDCTAG